MVVGRRALRSRVGVRLAAGLPRNDMPYCPALDGLRAISVLAVVLYHWNVPGFGGGYLGVEVFFVISGYLITALLIAEHARSGAVSLGAFWLRRARRLLPAVAGVLAVTTLFSALLLPEDLDGHIAESFAAIAYATNWYFIFTEQSYFESFGRPSLLKHLWSLAIEEQFYGLWPVFMVALLSVRRSQRVAWCLGLVALAAYGWMFWVHSGSPEDSRVYFGTDTRLGGILLGCAAAWAVRPWERRRRSSPTLSGAWCTALLVVLGYCFAEFERDHPFLYPGGFGLVALVTVLLVLHCFSEDDFGTRVLGSAPLKELGKRSYGLYLWHWPITQVTLPDVDVTLGPSALLLLRLALLVGFSEASYRLLELPVRNWNHAPQVAARTAAGLAMVLAGSLCLGMALEAPLRGSPPARIELDSVAIEAQAPKPVAVSKATAKADPPSPDPRPSVAPLLPGPGVVLLQAPHPEFPSPLRVLVLGDSVIQAMIYGRAAAPGYAFEINAKTSRSFQRGTHILQRQRTNLVGLDAVLVHLGTNGYLTDADFDAMMGVLEGIPVVFFMNVRVDRRWEAVVNDVLARGVGRWETAHLLDWHGFSADHLEWFGPDKTHLKNTAYPCLTRFVVESLARQALGPGPGSGMPCRDEERSL